MSIENTKRTCNFYKWYYTINKLFILSLYMGKKRVWRPRIYENKQQLEKAIKDYFSTTPEEEITITWLALHLGFNSRQALLNYQSREEFNDTIKRAKSKVELAYEKSLRKNWRSGDIFALKNFGWQDKVEMVNKNINYDVETMTDDELKQALSSL